MDTVHECDRQTDGQTDGQNYAHKDRATQSVARQKKRALSIALILLIKSDAFTLLIMIQFVGAFARNSSRDVPFLFAMCRYLSILRFFANCLLIRTYLNMRQGTKIENNLQVAKVFYSWIAYFINILCSSLFDQ